MNKITSIKAKEILDSRGKPTVEVEVCSEDICVVASVPSGASTGSREARNVSVEQAISNIENIIAPKIINLEVEPPRIDDVLLELDGTEDKSNLGANAILGVSLAVTRLGAKLDDKPLWKYINEISGVDIEPKQPKLFMNVILKKAPRWIVMAFIGLLVGVAGYFHGEIFGIGYDAINSILSGVSRRY